jgi:hypothetical protein
MGIWPLGLEGAGYYPMPSYAATFENEDVPAAAGQAAGGWNVRLISVLRGVLSLGPITLSAYETFFADWQEVGWSDFYLNVRHDLVSARADWVLGNEASLLVGLPVEGGPEIRIGAYDALRFAPGNPGTGHLVHQLGGIVMLVWERPLPGIDALSIFVRLGGYTHHAIRTDEAGTLGAISADHDLGGL